MLSNHIEKIEWLTDTKFFILKPADDGRTPYRITAKDDATIARVITLVSTLDGLSSIDNKKIESLWKKIVNQNTDAVCTRKDGVAITPRTAGQKKYVDAILNNSIVICRAPAGTGKTWLAIAAACRMLRKKEIEKIVLTRPVIEAGESLGFLPGGIAEKIDPYLQPLYDSLYDILGKPETEKLIQKGVIRIAPLAYMRGVTFTDSFVILDEAQNATRSQLKMLLTRFGERSKMVIEGDVTQIDLPGESVSCVNDFNLFLSVPDLAVTDMTTADIVRHPIVVHILKAYEEGIRT